MRQGVEKDAAAVMRAMETGLVRVQSLLKQLDDRDRSNPDEQLAFAEAEQGLDLAMQTVGDLRGLAVSLDRALSGVKLPDGWLHNDAVSLESVRSLITKSSMAENPDERPDIELFGAAPPSHPRKNIDQISANKGGDGQR